jgi:hypothetical protein
VSLVLLPAFLVLPNLSVFAFLALAPGHCLELGLASCSDLSVLRGMDPPGAPVKRACCCQRGSTDRNGGGGGGGSTLHSPTLHTLSRAAGTWPSICVLAACWRLTASWLLAAANARSFTLQTQQPPPPPPLCVRRMQRRPLAPPGPHSRHAPAACAHPASSGCPPGAAAAPALPPS